MKKHDLEFNKIFAAILVAGIIAYLAGFAANVLVPEAHETEKSVLNIDTSALEAPAAAGDAAPTGPDPVLALLAGADAKKGEALAKACLACHNFDKGGPNKIGPNLWGIVNNKQAHKEDFAYSDTIKDMGKAGGHWGYKNLNSFLWKPQVYAKGTKMTYPGLKKVADRASVMMYLRTLADTPEALPTPEEIASEKPVDAAPAAAATPAAPGAKPDAPAAPAVQAKDAPEAAAQSAKETGTPERTKEENSGTHSAEPTAATTPVAGSGLVKSADPAGHSADGKVDPGAETTQTDVKGH